MQFPEVDMVSKCLSAVLFIISISLLTPACSGGTQVSQIVYPQFEVKSASLPVGVTDWRDDGSVSAGMGVMGLFNVHIDIDNMSASMEPTRESALTDVLEVVDISNFLQLAPCTDCAKLKSVSINTDGDVVLSIGIRHPFNVGDMLKPISGRNRGDLHVFNVEGIVISNSEGTSFPGIGDTVSGLNLLSADGLTGYLDNPIDEFYPSDATVHPYVLHFDDYSAGNFDASNPMGFESVTTPPPSGNLVMAMGCDYNYQDYVFDLDESVDFIYAVGCTYAVSAAAKIQRFTPEYRVPQHNKKAASEVWIDIVENNLAAGNTSSAATLQISVVDINHGVAVGDALNEMLADSSVSGIKVEVPGVTSGDVTFSTVPLSGSGHDPSDPLVFEGAITNSSGAVEGTYAGLAKITDSYSPGLNTSPLLNGMDGIERVSPVQNPLEGLFAISEFATYQVFSIDIAVGGEITVLIPNGGEEWCVGNDEEITWSSEYVAGTVFIEYSKDNFVSDINSVAADAPNTGSFLWENIPDDPSDSVRIRVSATANPGVNDISDADFSIVTDSIWWRSHMYNLNNIGWNPTANMPNPSDLQQQWLTPNSAFKFTTPVIADDKIYFSTNSTYWERPDMTFYCYDLNSGSPIWSKPINPTSASTGWRVFSCPVWWHGSDGIDRIAVGGDQVYCFNADTGEQLWTYDTTYGGNNVGWWSNQMQEYNGMVLARSRYNPLYVLDFTTGDLISTVICSQVSEGGCTAKDGKVYINSGTNVDCADISTGNILWSTPLPSSAGNMNHWVNPSLVDDRIYVTTTNAWVCCYAIADGGGYNAGQNIWSWNDSLVSGTSMMAGASARQNENVTRLYIPSSGSGTYVYCIEDQGASASLIWRSSQNGSFEGAAVWANAPGYPDGVVYCPQAYGTLYAFNASNGALIWTFTPGGVTKCGVSIVDNRLVLMSNSDVRLLKAP
jgi:hypothetical protein